MYAQKSNKERIDVRQYSSAFIPYYISAAETSMGKRLFVVPGYIFLPKMIRGAEKVPEAEWKVIEAISDSHPSTFNTRTKQITDGPLKGLLILHINPVLKSVCIRAKLLGVTRDYWLAVRFETPNDPEIVNQDAEKVGGIDGAGKENMVELKQTKGEERKMATDEQINQAIERAKEIGVHAAARELSLPWQAVMSAAKKAGVEIAPKVVKPKKSKKTSAQASESSTPAKTNVGKNDVGKNDAEKNDAEKNGAGKNGAGKNDAGKNAVEEKPVEKLKRGRKKKAVYEVVPTPAAEEPAIEPIKDKKEEKAGVVAASELEIENAVLRKENEQLKAKIEKLQKALADLI